MTQTLEKLLYTNTYNIADPRYLETLNQEIHTVAERVRTDKAVPPATRTALVDAALLLVHTNTPPSQKLFLVAEAAAVTRNPLLQRSVGDLIEEKFPLDSDRLSPVSNGYHREIHREYLEAFSMTNEETPFSIALSRAATISEKIALEKNKEQTHVTTSDELRTAKRLEEERRFLANKPDDYDADTVPWSLDDEGDNESPEADAVYDRMVQDIFKHHVQKSRQKVA